MKSIKINRELHAYLTLMGRKGETYNEIIERLLNVESLEEIDEKKSPPEYGGVIYIEGGT